MATQVQTKPLAVITGASSGIGFELAKIFAKHGFDLAIVAEDGEIETAAGMLRTEGVRVEPIQADLTTYDGVEQVVSSIANDASKLSALVLNAGVGVGGEFLRTDLRAEIDMIKLNCLSTIHLAKRLVPLMVDRHEGHVLMTSSIAATMPAPFEAVYGATKAFVLSFSEALANELKDTGVTVTALQPGPTDTKFFERAGMQDTKVGSEEKDDPAQVAQQGFDAMMAGKDKVYAGSLKTRLKGHMTEVMPESTKAEQHRKLAEPGSGRK